MSDIISQCQELTTEKLKELLADKEEKQQEDANIYRSMIIDAIRMVLSERGE